MKKIDKNAIGVEVSWSFGYGASDDVKLDRAIARELIQGAAANLGVQFDDLIEDIEPKAAIKRGVKRARGIDRKKFAVHEMQRPNSDTPIAFGVYRVSGTGETGDEFTAGAVVRIEGDSVSFRDPDGSSSDVECSDIANSIAYYANDLRQHVVNQDISVALTKIGERIGWLNKRRNAGGIYFIQNSVDAQLFVDLLIQLEDLTKHESRSNQFVAQVDEIYSKPFSMKTWSGAASDSFTYELRRLMDDLDAMHNGGKMRQSTMTKRAVECEDLIDRAEKYRMFLASSCDGIKAQLEAIRGDFEKAIEGEDSIIATMAEVFEEALDEEVPVVAKKRRRAKATKKPEVEPAKTSRDFSMDMFDLQ